MSGQDSDGPEASKTSATQQLPERTLQPFHGRNIMHTSSAQCAQEHKTHSAFSQLSVLFALRSFPPPMIIRT